MILDALLSFSLTAGDVPTVTAVSGNILDLHLATGGIPVLANLQGARDLGIGDDPALKLLVQVTATFAGGTSLAVSFQGATDNGSGAPNAFVTWYTSPVYALATLVQGARLMDMDLPRPPAGVAVPRFLQLNYTIVGTMSGGGTLKSFIVLDRMDQMYQSTGNNVMGGYPAGITIAN
jgi:hypothetical protein